MTKRKALETFRNIYMDEEDPEDKIDAIAEVLEMESHRCVTKENTLEVLR